MVDQREGSITVVSPWQRVGVFAVVVTVLTPYVPVAGIGIRGEQIVLYTLGILGAVRFRQIGLSKWGWACTSLLCLYTATAATMTLLGPLFESDARSPLGALDSLLLPIATVLGLSFIVRPLRRPSALFPTAAAAVTCVMAVNAVIALTAAIHFPTTWLAVFWSGPQSPIPSVAEVSLTVNRYTGVFNQPAEAGLAYGVALLLLTGTRVFSSWSRFVLVTLVILGGTLSGSKTFYLSVPIALIAYFWGCRSIGPLLQRIALTLVMAGITVGLAFALGIATSTLDRWQGWHPVTEPVAILSSSPTPLPSPGSPHGEQASPGSSVGPPADPAEANPVDQLIMRMSANRYGTDGTLNRAIRKVLTIQPVLGVGLYGVGEAFDSSWVEAYVYAGLIGVGCLMTVLLILFTLGWQQRRDAYSSPLSFLFPFFLLAASLGIGALTANRVSTLVWVLVTLLYLGQNVSTRHPQCVDECASNPHDQRTTPAS